MNRTRVSPIVAGVIAAILLAACGGKSAPDAASAKQLATAISDTGLGCKDFAAGVATGAPGLPSSDIGTCTVGGKQMNLAVYQSAKDRDHGTIVRFQGCVGHRALNPKSTLTYSMLKGPTWTVVSADQGETTRVGDALHTSVVTVPC